MKAKKKTARKAAPKQAAKKRRPLEIPEEHDPDCRYYNNAAVGLKLLLDQANEGTHAAYTARLRRAAVLIMELAMAPLDDAHDKQLQEVSAWSLGIPF